METVVYYLVAESQKDGYFLLKEIDGSMIVEPTISVFGFLSDEPLAQIRDLKLKAVNNGKEVDCTLLKVISGKGFVTTQVL